mgnify:CR=1 FL=1
MMRLDENERVEMVSDPEKALQLLDTGEKVCPRCGHVAHHFDRLAVQPNFLPSEILVPVWKCPVCRHLFALKD